MFPGGIQVNNDRTNHFSYYYRQQYKKSHCFYLFTVIVVSYYLFTLTSSPTINGENVIMTYTPIQFFFRIAGPEGLDGKTPQKRAVSKLKARISGER